jgi:hypothetical protein
MTAKDWTSAPKGQQSRNLYDRLRLRGYLGNIRAHLAHPRVDLARSSETAGVLSKL